MTRPRPTVVLRLLREMEGYFELGLHDDVIRRANQLLHDEPGLLAALRWKGRALQALERWPDAIAVYERLRAEEPEGDEAYLGLGWCHKRAGRLDLALASLEALVGRRADHALAVYNLACYCAIDGQTERSLELLRRAVDRDATFRTHARDEADFDSIREEPRFRALLRDPSDDA